MVHPRMVFMGSPDEAIPVLEALLRLEWQVAAVYTPPDRRVGRGLRWAAPPVKEYAQRMGLPVCQPATLRTEEAVGELAAYAPDLVLVAAYGKLLPTERTPNVRTGRPVAGRASGVVRRLSAPHD